MFITILINSLIENKCVVADDLSGFLCVLGEMELIISSKGGGQEYSVDTCSDLDDILPTMLVCKQFFVRNLVPRLIEHDGNSSFWLEFGQIVINMNAG